MLLARRDRCSAAIGPVIELLLRTVYERDEAFQLLLTFALVLMFQDVLRFFWGANPQQLGNLSMSYGKVALGEVQVPTYNVLVIAASDRRSPSASALFLQRTRFGRILRATAENREMARRSASNVRWIYASVFTLGTVLGTRRRRARRARPPRLRSTCRWSWSSRPSRWS